MHYHSCKYQLDFAFQIPDFPFSSIEFFEVLLREDKTKGQIKDNKKKLVNILCLLLIVKNSPHFDIRIPESNLSKDKKANMQNETIKNILASSYVRQLMNAIAMLLPL